MTSKLPGHDQIVHDIVAAMPSFGARLYARARFGILNATILSLIRLAIRDRRSVLDIGSGFGLLGCYLALSDPELSYVGIELDVARVDTARAVSRRLKLPNVQFKVGDAAELVASPGQFDALLMIDLLHHVADSTKMRLLETSKLTLGTDGLLVIKDVDTKPRVKLVFTWIMDVLVARTTRMSYWSEDQLTQRVTDAGFRVDRYPVRDVLPYPHTFVVGRNRN